MENSKNCEKQLLEKLSIDREFLSIAQMYFLIDRIGIENQSHEAKVFWWISLFFDWSINRLDRSKALNFEFSLAFWLSVKNFDKKQANVWRDYTWFYI